MTLSPISRRAGMLGITAAVLIILSQVMRLVGGRLLGPDWATTPAYTLALLGMGTLLLTLTAIYTPEFAALGRLGLAFGWGLAERSGQIRTLRTPPPSVAGTPRTSPPSQLNLTTG